MKAKAQENVERVLRQAHEEAERIRSEAEGVMDLRTQEAVEAAGAIKAEAESEAALTREQAAREAERVIERGREQAREMLDEAKELRSKMLGDVVKRRNVARVQVAQLRAGRERLLDAYRMVRETLDQVTAELGRADEEARRAAEAAGERLSAELGATLEADLALLELSEPPLPEASEALVGETAPPAEVSGETAPPAEVVAAEPPAGGAEVMAAEPPAEVMAAEPPAGGAEVPPPDGAVEPAVAAAVASVVEAGEPEEHAAPADLIEGLPEAELDVVEPPAPMETVRVIVPSPPERPAPPEPAPVPAGSDEGATAGTADAAALDDLFARIRADREQAVAEAHRVLADPATEPAPESGTASGSTASNGTDSTATESKGSSATNGTNGASDEKPGAEDDLVRSRDERIAPLQGQLAKRLKRAVQDEQNDVLDRVRVHRGRPGLDDVLPDLEVQAARYREVGRSLLADAAQAGAETAGKSGASVDIADLAGQLAASIAEPLRSRLGSAFTDAERDDDDEAALVERIGAVYREWKIQRIERLAGDQAVAAYSRGVYSATPEGAALRWIGHDLDGPCPDCDDNALAGPTPRGDAYPTGQQHPPAHSGCRCLLVPAST